MCVAAVRSVVCTIYRIRSIGRGRENVARKSSAQRHQTIGYLSVRTSSRIAKSCLERRHQIRVNKAGGPASEQALPASHDVQHGRANVQSDGAHGQLVAELPQQSTTTTVSISATTSAAATICERLLIRLLGHS